ncbi:MAG: type II toxin-antitoxin system HipA family toxin [Proteobacteria bacterium]|nr:type II toxin-antitoxin system HipA family toxin [Pseudomonadota bacterium]
MDAEVLVYLDWEGVSVPVGKLWSRARKGKESATFEYDAKWLENSSRFSLEPALKVGPGPFHTANGKALFGALGDSAPDRWGRALMRRAERQDATAENRTPRTLLEVDYLLRVTDEARQGALRFATEPGGAFLAPSDRNTIPPLIDLPKLLSASDKISEDPHADEALRFLLAPGSSLGGARPKASVRDMDGHLAIAKFPRKEDETDAVLWEAVALKLAGKAGIEVPEFRVEAVAGRNVLVLRRFDRVDGARRPFLSAMSLLDARDNEQHSYLEIADGLRQHGARAKDDLRQLWRRMVFNVLISNTDDHLRNHGFLYESMSGWVLSPAYDLNPVPTDIKPRLLSTGIDPDDNAASLDLALEHAGYFELTDRDAAAIAKEVGAAVSSWRREASHLGLRSAEIDRMASAFEHDDLKQALAGC